MAVFRSIASSSSSSEGLRPVSDIIAEVSINSGEGSLIGRELFDDAVTLLVRTELIEPEEDGLRLTAEGDHFWSRISRLPPSGVKKWIREAVDAYSRGANLRWVIQEEAWSDAQILFLEQHRNLMVARLEVLDGLLGALQNWHFVSTLIGAAGDRSAAIAALQGSPFRFSKIQAQQIVDMRVSQRTALGRLALAEERDAIQAQLAESASDEFRSEPKGLPTTPGTGPESDPGDIWGDGVEGSDAVQTRSQRPSSGEFV